MTLTPEKKSFMMFPRIEPFYSLEPDYKKLVDWYFSDENAEQREKDFERFKKDVQ